MQLFPAGGQKTWLTYCACSTTRLLRLILSFASADDTVISEVATFDLKTKATRQYQQQQLRLLLSNTGFEGAAALQLLLYLYFHLKLPRTKAATKYLKQLLKCSKVLRGPLRLIVVEQGHGVV